MTALDLRNGRITKDEEKLVTEWEGKRPHL